MEALSVVDGIADPAFAVDGKYRLVAWNEGVERLLGHEARSVLGKRCYQVICGTDVFGNRFCRANCPVLNMVRHDERVNLFELNLPTAKAETTRIKISIIGVGRTVAEFAVLHQLSPSGLEDGQLSRLEMETNGTGKPQQPAETILRELSHAIQNSLQTIIGAIEFLNLPVTAPSEYHVILKEVRDIDKFIRESNEYFSSVRRVSSSVDPLGVLTSLQCDVGKRLADHGIRISMVCKDVLPDILVDPKEFRNAVRQVVNFSLILLPKGGEVLLDARQKTINGKEFVELSVTSNSESSLAFKEEDVFRPFVRVNEQRVGLSMVIAQQILRRQGGNIIFRKESENRGVFTISMEDASH